MANWIEVSLCPLRPSLEVKETGQASSVRQLQTSKMGQETSMEKELGTVSYQNATSASVRRHRTVLADCV